MAADAARAIRDEHASRETDDETDDVDADQFAFDEAETEGMVQSQDLDEHDGGEEPDFDDDEEHEFDGDEDDDGGESPRIGFRNIPTWKDAIGVMIARTWNHGRKSWWFARPGGRGGRGGGGRGRGRRPERR